MANLQPLISPSSICVIGASSDVTTIRGRLLQYLLGHHYDGRVYVVSRSSTEIQGIAAHPTVADLPEAADLAIILLPANAVAEVLEACGQRGIRAAMIISAGFGEEAGSEGAAREEQLREIAKRYDMAVSGPNTQGIINALKPMAATFTPVVADFSLPLLPEIAQGKPIAVIAQSGALSMAFLARSRSRQLRFNYHVSTGNQACLSAHDYLDYLLDEGSADIFLMYLEQFGDGKRFREVAAKAARAGKPLIIAKAGQSEASRRAAASHTGSLARGGGVDSAIFAHHAAIRGDDIDHMLDIAAAFSLCRLPAGRRVAVVTGSGASAVWMSDILSAHGLEVPLLEPEIQARIGALLPSFGSSQNPIDMSAQAVRDVGYGKMVAILQDSKNIDAVMILPSLATQHISVRDAKDLAIVNQTATKPILACTYTTVSDYLIKCFAEANIPVYTSMPSGARALAAMVEYAAAQPHAASQILQSDTSDIVRAQTRRQLLEASDDTLSEYTAKQILSRYGVPCTADELATDEAQAIAAARRIGKPVALKVQSSDIAHKTEAGAVLLSLDGDEAVARGYRTVLENAQRAHPDARVDGVLVQPMAERGTEMIIGVTRDAEFGPMLMVGLGGIYTEVLKDVAFAPVPIDQRQAHVLVNRLKNSALLGAVRGKPPADVEALASLMVSISRFAADHADIVEMLDSLESNYLGPVIVHAQGQGLTVADALIVRSAREASPEQAVQTALATAN